MDMMQKIQKQVETCLEDMRQNRLPPVGEDRFSVYPLAKGEYNLNYRITNGKKAYVFRVNMDTQIGRDDQILYEYKALKLLSETGVTPLPFHVDDTRRHFDTGILIMEYIPGRHMDYRKDTEKGAWLFSVIHQTDVEEKENHLIREDAPLTLIFEECSGLLEKYITSELADLNIRDYLADLRQWADEARKSERYFQEDPINCIVNTEVNSNNFIINDEKKSIHLVDWEMPRWGDASSDLCHFMSPLTTLWKTDYRMTEGVKKAFLKTYAGCLKNTHLKDTLHERVAIKEPFVCLRGISWSAMGWVAYQTDFSGNKNPDTWQTLKKYMDYRFIRELFDPFMK